MARCKLLLWLALSLAVNASPSAAQFIPREALIPAELAAQKIAPDRAVPNPVELDKIGSLERQAGIERPCNATWDPALEAPRRELLSLYESTYGPDHPATARPLLSLLCHFAYHSKTVADRAERERIIDRLVAMGRKHRQPTTLFTGLAARSQLRIEQGKPEQAIDDAAEALAQGRKLFVDRPAVVAST